MAKPTSLRVYLATTARSESQTVKRLKRLQSSGVLSQDGVDRRLARALPPRPAGELIWFHVARTRSVPATLELLDTLRDERPDLSCLLTTTNPLPEQMDRLNNVIHMPLPEECVMVVRRFLDHWSPTVLGWVGDGFRPSLLWHVQEARIPSVAIAAPECAQEFDARFILPSLRQSTLSQFDHVIASNNNDATTWLRMGVNEQRIDVVGPLEEGSLSHRFEEHGFVELSQDIGTRPTWFAARLSAGEATDVIKSHTTVMRHAHRLLLIATFKDAAAQDTFEKQAASAGLRVAHRSNHTPVSEEVQVLIADPEIDESALWYRAAPTSFLGSSLTKDGGISPNDAAGYGSAIVHGPHVFHHENAYARLATAGATRMVRSDSDLSDAIRAFLAPDASALAANAAWTVMSSGAEVSTRTADLLHDLLDLREAMDA
ncbi:3-deoxy-D-manno-octulosonic acid transferase [Celeribacter sp.]|uniref:3-deoxy-D-manno-octulosonic acid transferase n=1 Tax=Celeribacter sp. TaxID=1890673 RepID=UPI003A92FEFE